MNRSEKLYKALKRVVDLDAVRENRFDAAKSKVAGFMDLNFDYLSGNGRSARFALSHYYRQNGDMIADPDMEILVRFHREEAEALTFQDVYGFSTVEAGSPEGRRKASARINSFLVFWLDNLHHQGHRIDEAAANCNSTCSRVSSL